RGGCLKRVKDARQIDGQDTVPQLRRGRVEFRFPAHTGISDDNIRRTGRRKGRFQGTAVCHISDVSSRSESGGCFGRLFVLQIEQPHRGAACRQHARGRLSDSICAAGHDGCFTVEVERHRNFSSTPLYWREMSGRGFTRRSLLAMLSAPTLRSWGQGVSSRSVKPMPRGKPSGLPFHARFTDIAAEAGLRAPLIYGSADHKDYILETVGCGCAFIDYDNDGWLDIFLLCGTRLDGAPEGATNRLYKNNRDGTFTDVTEKAGLRRTGWASAVAVGDYDNDGFDDLFVTYWGQNVLYRNNGDGTFTDVTAKVGLMHSGTRWGSGCTFVDYDRDGRLDLFVANYLEFDAKAVPKPGENSNCSWKGIPVNCGPRGLPPSVPALYHNNGDGTFTDVSVKSGITKATGSYAMTAVAADFDNDGWPDIYVACDSTPSFLLRNNHDGTFTDVGLESGVALNEDGMEQAGMGLGIGDYNLDGNLDIFKTHFADDTSILYRNDGKGNFEDVTIRAGLGVETRFIGWGAGIFDFDNDGLPDLMWATGSVYPE